MADKDDRISFRAGDVRKYNIALYKSKYKESTGKDINNTDIMIKALDLFLANEECGISKRIKDYEESIIKIILGVNRKDFKNDEKYLAGLKSKIKELKSTLKDID